MTGIVIFDICWSSISYPDVCNVCTPHHCFSSPDQFCHWKKKCRERTYVTVDGVEIIDAWVCVPARHVLCRLYTKFDIVSSRVPNLPIIRSRELIETSMKQRSHTANGRWRCFEMNALISRVMALIYGGEAFAVTGSLINSLPLKNPITCYMSNERASN